MFCFTVYLIFSFRVVITMDFIKFICGNKESFLPRGNGQVKVTELSQLFNVTETGMHIRCREIILEVSRSFGQLMVDLYYQLSMKLL